MILEYPFYVQQIVAVGPYTVVTHIERPNAERKRRALEMGLTIGDSCGVLVRELRPIDSPPR